MSDEEIEAVVEDHRTVIINASRPQYWKRRAKYKAGSNRDEQEGRAFGNEGHVGTVREFELQGSEVCVALLETTDGKLKVIEDLSD